MKRILIILLSFAISFAHAEENKRILNDVKPYYLSHWTIVRNKGFFPSDSECNSNIKTLDRYVSNIEKVLKIKIYGQSSYYIASVYSLKVSIEILQKQFMIYGFFK